MISSNSVFNDLKKDILIENGKIVEIADSISILGATEIVSDNLKVSIGWFDMSAKLSDPGIEHKEDIESGLKAAAKGGFTEIACLPNTKPVIQSKDNIHYLRSKSSSNVVELHVIAAATENLDGKSMTEVFDLNKAGAVAFSDGGYTISNSGLVVRLIQYLRQINGLLMLHSEEKSLTAHGVMNEGVTSVYLGQQGMPSIAEYMMVSRNIDLLKYAQGKLHFNKISTAESVELIRKAKQEGLNVTCDVAVVNLVFDETALLDFDTNFKTNPPLRTPEDLEALWNGLADGTIDVIVTDHDPQDEESKKLEFDLADFGMIQLETAFSLLNQKYHGKISMEKLLNKFSTNPRQLLNLSVPQIEVGSVANLTVFDTEIEWLYTEKEGKSKSKNSPLFGQTLKGKALAIFNKGQFVDLRN